MKTVTPKEGAVSAMTQRDRIVGVIETLHDEATVLVNTIDHGGAFREDRWERPGGGGGVTRCWWRGGRSRRRVSTARW